MWYCDLDIEKYSRLRRFLVVDGIIPAAVRVTAYRQPRCSLNLPCTAYRVSLEIPIPGGGGDRQFAIASVRRSAVTDVTRRYDYTTSWRRTTDTEEPIRRDRYRAAVSSKPVRFLVRRLLRQAVDAASRQQYELVPT